MSIWRRLHHGVRGLRYPRAVDRDVSDEVTGFFDAAVEDLVASGLSPKEARRRVRLKYGPPGTARDAVRGAGWEHYLTRFATDLRYGARLLRRSPGFTVVTVVTLGLGIGSATAIFSVVSRVLFDPLPYPHPERILAIADRSADGEPVPVTFGTYRELADRNRSLQDLAVFRPWQPTITGRGDPQRLDGQRVSAGYLRVLGIDPMLGPGFREEDDFPGGPDVVVLGHGLWRRVFGSDSTIVGGTVQLDGEAYRVVGIMPPGFESVPPFPAEVWSLLRYDSALPTFDAREWGHHLAMVGRLEDGISLDVAREELERLAAIPIAERPRPRWAALENGLTIRTLKDRVASGERPVMLALFGAAGLLLIIACVNAANLLLAHGTRRHRELTMRMVLGAGAGRLLRQLLTEGLLLASLGGAVGLVLGQLGIAALIAASPPEIHGIADLSIKPFTFVFALGVTTVLGLSIGLVPVVRAVRPLRRGATLVVSPRVSPSHLTTRRALVVAEVAVALVLLVGAGLLLRSMQRLAAVSPGFDPSSLVAMQVQTSGPRFATDEAVHQFFERALSAVRAVPGVTAAATTSQLPLSGDVDEYGVQFEGDDRPDAQGIAYRYAASADYFATMGVPILRGRAATNREAGGTFEAVVSETVARRVAGGSDPIGLRIHVGRPDWPWFTIVGVAGDVKQTSLEVTSPPGVYVAPTQWYFADGARWIVARTTSDPTALIPAIKRAIWSADPDQPIVRTTTMETLVVQSEARRRFALTILEAFALVALVLATIGLYGVIAGSVAERMHELGIRSALGASDTAILGLVIRQGMTLTACGILLGLGASVFAAEAVVTLLFEVSRLDPVTYAGVIGALAGASLLASWFPAARAAGVEPGVTLRGEGQ